MLIDPVTVTMSRHDLERLIASARSFADILFVTGNDTTKKALERRCSADRILEVVEELEDKMEAGR